MGNIPSPLSACCGPDRKPQASSTAFNKVELAASELFNLGVATAYHTSVLVNGEEFFFSDSGIFSDRALNSHEGEPSERIVLGYSEKTGSQLLRSLQPHFQPGTYDLVCKNCNSFTDCAIHYLLGQRLQVRFCALERLGRTNTKMLSELTQGMYKPNLAVQYFQVDTVLAALHKLGGYDGQAGEGNTEAATSRAALMPGNRVTIIGLASATDLNGQGATVSKFNPWNGRWEVFLHLSGVVKALRAENLRPAGELVLETGDCVRIWGLKSVSGQELNGKEAEIIRYMHEVSRYEVRLESSEVTKALKPENLQRITL